MKKRILLLTILLLAFMTSFGARFYAIGVFATKYQSGSEASRYGIQSDFDKFNSFVDTISKAIQYEAVKKYCTGDELSVARAQGILDSLNATAEDIVFVYFDTHGLRFNNQVSEYPGAFLDNFDEKGYPGAHTVDFLAYRHKI